MFSYQETEALNGVIWNKTSNEFVRIFSIQSYENLNQERLSISRKNENYDYNGTKFRFASFAIENLVNFYEDDTVVSGVHGDLWQILAEMLNFKIHVIKLADNQYGSQDENGTWSGLIGYISRNETDIIPRNVLHPSRLSALHFTLATWKTGYRLYIEKYEQHHKAWMIELFSRELWFSTIGIFFALTIANFSTHVLNSADNKPRDSIYNLRDHFFYIYSIFCNQGWAPQQLDKRSKILIISARLLAWLLVIAFSSKLISHIAQRKFHPPFNDLESLYKDTDYKLIVQPKSFIYSIFQHPPRLIHKRIFNSRRFIQARPAKAEKMICTGKYAYLEVQDVVEAEMTKPCEVIFVGKPYFVTGIAAGLVHGFKNRRTIDIGILKLHEFGLTSRIKSKWLKKVTIITSSSQDSSPGSIKLEHVSLMFAMLGFAVLLSLVILFIENIIYLGVGHNHRKKR